MMFVVLEWNIQWLTKMKIFVEKKKTFDSRYNGIGHFICCSVIIQISRKPWYRNAMYSNGEEIKLYYTRRFIIGDFRYTIKCTNSLQLKISK